MLHKSFSFLWIAVAAAILGCGSGDGTTVTKLQGAGASFPAPLYSKWFKEFTAQNKGVQIDYQSVGSGAGVNNVIDGTVDFGASDAAMKPEEIEKVSRGVQLLPMTAGSIVLAYNLEGVKELKLSRKAYAGIFLGKITKWNDEAIAATNDGVELPDSDINVVVRADSSGTTYVFTKHLSEISEEFNESPGTNKMPNWPVGTKSKGNEGITSALNTTPGSIGYIEYGYAKHTDLPMASLENKAGKFIQPTIEAAQATLASVVLPEDLIAWMPDPEGEECYPIVTFTWLLCYKKYDNAKKVEVLKKAIHYCLEEGQKSSEELGYIPLPAPVVEKVKAALENIQAEAGKAEA